MTYNQRYTSLLYQYEVLRARIEIREHFLKTVVREVYENIGQVLSLIRVQLSLLQTNIETAKNDKIDSSGELVGKTIRDLRNMCQLFYPEVNIVSGAGFKRAIEYEIKTLYPKAVCHIYEEKPAPEIIKEEKALVLFGIFLEILTLIRQRQNAQLNFATVKYIQNEVRIVIRYSGETIRKKKSDMQIGSFDLSIFERAEVIGGYLEIKSAASEQRTIKLVTPIN